MALGAVPDPTIYLKHLPTIAKWIECNKRISGFEMTVFRLSFPEVYRFFKGVDYAQISKSISPFAEDVRWGHYVRLALSPQGEQWIKYAIDLVHKS